jgi:hypothetical protein
MSDIRDESPEALREFLDSERACPDPPPAVEQRVFSRLATTLALSPGLPAPPAPAAPAVPSAGTKILLAGGARRVLSIFLVGAAVGAGGYGTFQAVRQRPAAPLATAPHALEPPAPAPALLPEPSPPEVAPPPPAPAPPVRAREPGESRDQMLAAERRLLEQARTALVKGDDDTAITTLRRHARIFVDGQLAEERDALLIRALVGKGEYAQARERASRFHKQHPRSLFAGVVDQAMQAIP